MYAASTNAINVISTYQKPGDTQSQVCKHCGDAGVKCDRSIVRFRNGLALSKEPDLAFPGQQNWPQVYGRGMQILQLLGIVETITEVAVRFHDETPEITSLYVDRPEESDSQHTHHSVNNEASVTGENLTSLNDSLAQQHHAARILSQLPCGAIVESHSPSSLSAYSNSSPRTRYNSEPFHRFTEREGILIRNFVENMALWVRLCRSGHGFG